MEKRPASNIGQQQNGLQPTSSINKGLQPRQAPSNSSNPPSGGSSVKKP